MGKGTAHPRKATTWSRKETAFDRQGTTCASGHAFFLAQERSCGLQEVVFIGRTRAFLDGKVAYVLRMVSRERRALRRDAGHPSCAPQEGGPAAKAPAQSDGAAP